MVMNTRNDDDGHRAMVLEVLTAFKRAGASIIVTYHAREAARKKWIA
jgi:delta-aminolevulinic acid dehydratase/porphobilinogen synthase